MGLWICRSIIEAHGGQLTCQPNGAYYSPDHLGTRIKALLRKAGFPNFSLHSLRHSHASILLGKGTPIANRRPL